MTKVNAYDLPKSKFVEVEMYNIEWDTEGETPNRPLPPIVVATVDVNEGNVIAQAIDKATALTGYAIKDADFKPIDYDNVVGPPELDETLEYDGEVYNENK